MKKKQVTLQSFMTYLKCRTWEEYVFLLLLILGIVLRFYGFPERYGFDFDSARDAIFALKGGSDMLIPPLGPASALGPFHFGPLYYYQLILFRVVVPTLYSPWIYSGILSCIGVLVGYKIGEVLVNRKVGLLMAGFIAVSNGQILLASGLSNPNLVVLPSLVTLWLTIKLLKEKTSYLWFIIYGLTLGVGINDHYQMLPLLLLPVAVLLFGKQKKISYIFGFIGGFLLTLLPLLLYESVHGFSNLEGFLFYLREGRNAVYIPNSWKIYLADFLPQFLTFLTGLPAFLAIVLLGCSVVYVFQNGIKGKDKTVLILAILFGIELLFLRYISSREYYYLVYLHPFIFIFLSLGVWWTFTQKMGKYLGVGIVLVLIYFIGISIPSLVRSPESHAETKVIADVIRNNYPDNEVAIVTCGERIKGRMVGVVYLLSQSQKTGGKRVVVGIHDSQSCGSAQLQNKEISKRLPLEALHKQYHNNRSIEIVTFKPDVQPENIQDWEYITIDSVYNDNAEKWFTK